MVALPSMYANIVGHVGATMCLNCKPRWRRRTFYILRSKCALCMNINTNNIREESRLNKNPFLRSKQEVPKYSIILGTIHK